MIDDREIRNAPTALAAILRDTERSGFSMASERQTGSMLRTLAASKPGGQFLELGTGTGVGTAWLLAGMDATATLATVDNDPRVQAVAKQHLGHDRRVTFHLEDGGAFLQHTTDQFDLIFADTWPGKFSHLELTLSLVKIGGIYFIDDLLPQPNWPEDHAPKVPALVAELERRRDFVSTKFVWASGLMILVRTENQSREQMKTPSSRNVSIS